MFLSKSNSVDSYSSHSIFISRQKMRSNSKIIRSWSPQNQTIKASKFNKALSIQERSSKSEDSSLSQTEEQHNDQTATWEHNNSQDLLKTKL